MKEYTFWREVKKTVREECTIKANSIEEATKKLSSGDFGTEFHEVYIDNEQIIDEGTDENKSY